MGGQLPLVTLNVRSRYGEFAPIRFCVDSGADLIALPIYLAEEEGIAFSRTEQHRGTVSGIVGSVERYLDVIHIRMFGEDFTWPCSFVESRRPTFREPYGVLGQGGFLSCFNTCMKDPTSRSSGASITFPAGSGFSSRSFPPGRALSPTITPSDLRRQTPLVPPLALRYPRPLSFRLAQDHERPYPEPMIPARRPLP